MIVGHARDTGTATYARVITMPLICNCKKELKEIPAFFISLICQIVKNVSRDFVKWRFLRQKPPEAQNLREFDRKKY